MKRPLIRYLNGGFEVFTDFSVYRLNSTELKAFLGSFLENGSYTFGMAWLNSFKLLMILNSSFSL